MSYDSVVTALSPLARWKLNETAGATSAADATGHGWTATVASATCTFGQSPGPIAASANTAVLTDGTAGYLTTGLVSSATASMTLLAWVKISGSTHGPVLKLGTSVNGYAIGLGGTTFDNSGTNMIALYDGLAWQASGIAMSTGAWHLFGLELDSIGRPLIWLDGTAVWANAGASAPNTPTTGGAIGYDLTLTRYFGGQIGEAAIFSGQLGATNWTNLYNAGIAAGSSSRPFREPAPLRRQAIIRASSY